MNPRHEHPGQPNMFAQTILASAHPATEQIVYTLHLRFPRIILPENLTHRVFNRNTRSSRAVPIKTLIQEARDMPFVPWHWGKNQKGMQASEECNALVGGEGVSGYDSFDNTFDGMGREAAWRHACNAAVRHAEAFMKAGYHKQVVNRLLEPFVWTDMLVTATDWKNFLHLRDHPDAEPHIRDLACLVRQAMENAEVQKLGLDDWHLPYITEADRHHLLVDSGRLASDRYTTIAGTDDYHEWLRCISAARCARISYKPFDGDASYERELERFNMLVGNDAVHASPLEHQCKPDRVVIVETSKWSMDGDMLSDDSRTGFMNEHLHGSLRGFIQNRKLVPNEAVHG